MSFITPKMVCNIRTCKFPFRADIVANPKAVAAQTFKSTSMDVDYCNSHVWAEIHSFFTQQISIEPIDLCSQLPQAVTEPWIAYPWLLAEEFATGTAAVWLDENNWVRHVRLYRTETEAHFYNQRLISAIRVASIKWPGLLR